MASIRAGAVASERIAAAGLQTPDVLAVAAALRWERPDLTGQLAEHVLATAATAGDRDQWLRAAGWLVHARSATGDGRPTAATALEGIRRWGASALTEPAAHRLRVELALVAVDTGQTDRARALLAPVIVAETTPLLGADARAVVARCAVEDAPGEVKSELRNARAAWSEVSGPDVGPGLASIELMAAAAHRRGGRPDSCAAAANAGLTRLTGGLQDGAPGTPAIYLAAALTREWISALLDTGRLDEAGVRCEALFTWLGEPLRPSRQLARLRLTVARALAPGVAPQSTADALRKAAQDAAESDAPDLEVMSRSALAAVLQQLGQVGAADAAVRLAELAERRDKHRDRLFRAVLGAANLPGSDALATPAPVGPPQPRIIGVPAAVPVAVPARAVQQVPAVSTPVPVGGGEPRPTPPTRQRTAGLDPVVAAALDRRETGRLSATGSAGGDATAAPGNGGPPRPGTVRSVPDLPDEPAAGAETVPREPAAPTASLRPIAEQWPWVDPSPDMAEPEEGERTTGGHDTGGANTGGSDAGGQSAHPQDPAGSAPAEPARGDDVPAEALSVGTPADVAGIKPVEPRPSDCSQPVPDWPWGGRPGDSPIGDQLVAHLQAAGTNHGDLPGPATEGPKRDLLTADVASDPASDPATDPAEHPTVSEPPSPADTAPDGASLRGASDLAAIPTGRRPIDDPWTTGRWLGPISRTAAATPAAAPAVEHDRGAGSVPTDPNGPAEKRPAEIEAPGSAAAAQPPSGRLRAALDDLDRAWSLATAAPADPEPAPPPATRPDAATGCRITIDVARDGRRFAGPRAAAVLRTVAGRLHPRLPAGAHLGTDDRDGLWVELAAMEDGSAASWMHQTLPGLIDDLSLDHDLARLHLRSIVSDANGPVGAQLLVRLDQAPPSLSGALLAPEPASGGASACSASAKCGCPTEAVISTGDTGSPPPGPPTEVVPPASTGPGPDNGTPPAPVELPEQPVDAAPSGGRHHATGRTPFQPTGQPPPNGRRRRREPEPSPPSERPDHPNGSGTEGLGLADLLAGALAAYRGI